MEYIRVLKQIRNVGLTLLVMGCLKMYGDILSSGLPEGETSNPFYKVLIEEYIDTNNNGTYDLRKIVQESSLNPNVREAIKQDAPEIIRRILEDQKLNKELTEKEINKKFIKSAGISRKFIDYKIYRMRNLPFANN